MSDGESYPGVRAMQPADSDLSKFRMRDFPLGSAFAFPIQPSDRAARLFVADGVRLNICSAAIEEVEERMIAKVLAERGPARPNYQSRLPCNRTKFMTRRKTTAKGTT